MYSSWQWEVKLQKAVAKTSKAPINLFYEEIQPQQIDVFKGDFANAQNTTNSIKSDIANQNHNSESKDIEFLLEILINSSLTGKKNT